MKKRVITFMLGMISLGMLSASAQSKGEQGEKSQVQSGSVKQTEQVFYINGVKAVKVNMNGRKISLPGFSVEPASPNPFIEETHISYRLPKEGQVQVSITDLNGRSVKSWTEEVKGSGKQELVWNGTDASGNLLKAGVYFCTLHYAGVKKTCKLVKAE
jgi:FlgD Ig-like domain